MAISKYATHCGTVRDLPMFFLNMNGLLVVIVWSGLLFFGHWSGLLLFGQGCYCLVSVVIVWSVIKIINPPQQEYNNS